MGAMSIWHWVIVLAIILILFGPGKLPDVFRQAGKGLKAFKDASEGKEKDGDDAADPDEEEEVRREIRRRKAEKRKQIAAKAGADDLDDDEGEKVASAPPQKGKSDS